LAKKRARDDYSHAISVPLWGWGVIILGTIFRLVLAQTLELRTDEAYYWLQSKEWVLSTLDHPPLSLWFIKLGTLIFGDTNLGVRVPFIISFLLTQILIIKSVQMTAREPRALFFAILAPEAMLFFAHLVILAGPDGAMLLCLTLMLYALIKLEVTGEQNLWMVAGLAAGLAALAKYAAIFYAPAVLAFVFINRRNRKYLTTPYPWLAASLAFFVFSPVLIWNAMNDFISFKFQGDRLIAEGFKLITFFDFLGMELVLVGFLLLPLLIWGAIWATLRAMPEKSGILILLGLAVLVPLGYFTFRSFSLRINVTWGYIIWIPAVIATSLYLDRLREMGEGFARFTWNTARFALILGFILVFAAFSEYVLDTKPRLGKSDPYGKEAGYGEIAEKLLAESIRRKATWIATTDYRTFAMLKWHLRSSGLPIVQLNERSRYIGFKQANVDEQRGLHIISEGKNNPAIWVALPTSRERLGTFERKWRGLTYDNMIVDLVAPFKLELNPPRDSILFTPRKLI
jgi:4-amino-4-deoxy-L-arabinose transferase-like glycosyltransferase